MTVEIKASEAKEISLKNPSFKAKLEMYENVLQRIKELAEEGETKVILTKAEHYALEDELKDLGYTRTNGQYFTGGIVGGFTVNIQNALSESINSEYTYYWN